MRRNSLLFAPYSLLAGVLALAGCIINFKSETPKQQIIHVDVQCAYPGKCELNTFGGYYKKEIAPGHYAQSELAFDPGQQLLILNKALVLHFYNMPATFTHTTETDTQHHSIRIHADTLDHTITWQGSIEGLRPAKYHPEQLYTYIDSMLRSTDAWKVLPKAAE